MRRDKYLKQSKSIKKIPIGKKRYYETLTKPKFIWLDNLLNKLSDILIDLAFNIKRLNREYNEVEYQKMRYRTVYKTEYI